MTNAPAFPAPSACASLYTGQVMHARMKPVTHRFTYRVFSLLVDLGQLEKLDRVSPLFSVGRWNLLSFSERDHGPRDGSPLRAYVEHLLARADCDIEGGRVLLWCYPRVLGFVFNPLSVYYCYAADGRLAALVYEVRNTFGETHSYVAPIENGEQRAEGLHQERDKLFYVSPFLDMTMRYRFRLQPPGERLNVRILETDAQGPILAATFAGVRSDVTTRNLLGAFLRIPLLTFKIVAAIHWEAFRLALKGLRLRKRPARSRELSHTGSPLMTMMFMPDSFMPIDDSNIKEAARHYPFAVRQALNFATHLERGRLDVHMPDGRNFRFQGHDAGPEAVMIVHDLGFARRLAAGGEVGIAEAFLKGEWESPNLTHFLELFCVNQPVIQRLLDGKPLIRMMQLVRHWLNRNTRAGSRRNIHAHYDLGNRFYSAWLDKTMTYSSALFTGVDGDLASAQTAKYRALAKEIGLAPEHHVLEIGCGWGGFAEFAARDIGCHVTGLTISQEQFDFAQARMQAAGLSDRVEIKMLDYRDEKGTFDRIASIEMFEAVGEEYWPTYFGQLRDRLKPGGIAGLQVITIQDALFKSYKSELDFIRRYVFPGGMLPTPTIMREMGTKFGFRLSGERIFGLDYATTLSHWRERFRQARPQLTPLGFDEQFRRLWEYYLSYCEAGFRAGTIDVRQMVFSKT